MNGRESPFSLSFSVGTWLGTRVRVSAWFPLILILFWMNLGLTLGTTCALLLFVSVIVHEFFHVYGARLTGGDADEILIWPAGGLAYCQPGPSFRSELLTTAAGPLANILIALAILPVAMSSGQLSQCWHPVVLPAVELTDDLLADWGLLLFAINVKLVYLNLLPVLPFDGGRMLQTMLSRSWDGRMVRKVSLWVGVGVSLLMFMIGHAVEPETGIALVSIAAFIFLMNYITLLHASLQEQISGMGFDSEFGDSYLTDTEDDEPQPGMMEQWKQNREAKKREREEAERVEEESRLDALLDKVHQHGMQSLTASEQKFLKQASQRRSRRQ